MDPNHVRGIDPSDGSTFKLASDVTLADIKAAMEFDATQGSGQELNCVANATNYTKTVVDDAYYTAVAENGTIYLGFAGTTVTDANKEHTIAAGNPPYRFKASGTTLNYSTENGAGILGRIARVS